MTTANWKTIKTALEQAIVCGDLAIGDRIPTEAELARQHGVGRHSVRRAVADLARQGRLSVEQGRGTFVGADPQISYEIGKRTRRRRNLVKQGIDVSGDLLDCVLIKAPSRVGGALRLPQGAIVSKSRRMTLADGVPIAVGTAFHDAARFPGFIERRSVLGSTTETYRSYGIADYLRAETTLHSRLSRADEARLLRQHPDLPVTVVCAIDSLLDGTPISFSEVVWSASRVKFTITGDKDD